MPHRLSIEIITHSSDDVRVIIRSARYHVIRERFTCIEDAHRFVVPMLNWCA